jgi:hypothetical protein
MLKEKDITGFIFMKFTGKKISDNQRKSVAIKL